MKMTGAQALVEGLRRQGVDTIFGLPGGAVLDIYDALLGSGITHVLTRHECAAAHAASGYARASGRVGVCLATSGPGATNLITGIANAYLDSTALVALTGQVPVARIGQDVFQEVDITGATAPLCKHNMLIRHPSQIPAAIMEAFHIASTGRPGPVLVDIPSDVAGQTAEMVWPERVDLPGYRPVTRGNGLQVKKVAEALAKCRRPLILAGGGVLSSGAAGLLRQLAQDVGIPVATTLMGIGALPAGHRLNLGLVGTHGVPGAELAFARADLVLALGARLGDRAMAAASLSSDAVLVHIDIDPAEIGKNHRANIPLVGDIKQTLTALLDRPMPRFEQPWMDRDTRPEPETTGVAGFACGLLRGLGELFSPERPVYTTSVGQHGMWAARSLPVEEPGSFLASGGLGTMDYGLPAAIGAAVACPGRPVVAVLGDGSLQMGLGELGTLCAQGAPVHILLCNNRELAMVRELQDGRAPGRRMAVALAGNPDFQILGRAYGLPAWRVARTEEAEAALQAWAAVKGPALLELDLCALAQQEGEV